MKINFYNRESSKIPFPYETATIHPLILLADTIMYGSVSACAFYLYFDIDNWSDEAILTAFSETFKDEENCVKSAEDLIAHLPMIKKLRKIKHKDKKVMMVLGSFNSIISSFKHELKDNQKVLLVNQNLFELVNFVEDGALELRPLYFLEDAKKEDEFIQEISNTLTERENFLSIDGAVDEIYEFTTLDSSENKACDFIKIPLWEFPPFIGLNYAQMKYSRDNLTQPLSPFKTNLNELSRELFNISFSHKNIPHIKQIIREKLSALVAPVQKSIDDSMYISQLKNKFPGTFNLKFCLGITPAETIVNIYEKLEVILPYVAGEIKQQIARQIDLNATYVFTYFEIHAPDPADYSLQIPKNNS